MSRKLLALALACMLFTWDPTAWAQEWLDAVPEPATVPELTFAPRLEAAPLLDVLPLSVRALPGLMPEPIQLATVPRAPLHPVIRFLRAQGTRARTFLGRLRGGSPRGERLWTLAARPFIGRSPIRSVECALTLDGGSTPSIQPLGRPSKRTQRSWRPAFFRVPAMANRPSRNWHAAAYVATMAGAWLLQHFGLLPGHVAPIVQLAALLPPLGPPGGGDDTEGFDPYEDQQQRMLAATWLLEAYRKSKHDEATTDDYAQRLLELAPTMEGLAQILYMDIKNFGPLIERLNQDSAVFKVEAAREERALRQTVLENFVRGLGRLDLGARAEKIAAFAETPWNFPTEEAVRLLARNPDLFAPIIEHLASHDKEFARLWREKENSSRKMLLHALWRKAASKKERTRVIADLVEQIRRASTPDDDVLALAGDGAIAGDLADALMETRPALAERLRERNEAAQRQQRREILRRYWAGLLETQKERSDAELAENWLGADYGTRSDPSGFEIPEALAAERPDFAQILQTHPMALRRAETLREDADTLMETPADALVQRLFLNDLWELADQELIIELMRRRPDMRAAMQEAWREKNRELVRKTPTTQSPSIGKFDLEESDADIRNHIARVVIVELSGEDLLTTLASAEGRGKDRVMLLAIQELNELLPDFWGEYVLRQTLRDSCETIAALIMLQRSRIGAAQTEESVGLQSDLAAYVQRNWLMDFPQEFIADILYETEQGALEFAPLINILKFLRPDFAAAARQQEDQWAYLARLRKP